MFKRNPSPLLDPAELQFAPLTDDPEFLRAQEEIKATEQSLLEAEKHHANTQAPNEERAAWREVEALRRGLTMASESLTEIAGRKSH
jgi:hypothetical protein